MSALQLRDYLPEPRKYFASINGQNNLNNPSSEKSTDILKSRVKYLFEQFLKIYDERWADKIPTEDIFNDKIELWLNATRNLTNEQMRRGLNLSTLKCAWPPSIAEFLAFAVEPVCSERTHHDAYKDFTRALPKPPGNPDIARSAMSEIWGKLGIRKSS